MARWVLPAPVPAAKLNEIDPQAWLADVLARFPDHPPSRSPISCLETGDRKKLSDYLTKIARLGGYLNTVMWRGLSRLTDIELGAIIGAKIVGN